VAAARPSTIAAALISCIEGISLSGRRANRQDRFRGHVGLDPPSQAGDRVFTVAIAGSNRFEALCQSHYEMDLELVVYYRGTMKPETINRIADDQHEITKAILTAGSFHGASNPAILHVELSDPTPAAEVGEGLLAASRGVTVRFDDTMTVGD
jgi:hypothetical protein